MKFMKRAEGSFHKFHLFYYEITTRVRSSISVHNAVDSRYFKQRKLKIQSYIKGYSLDIFFLFFFSFQIRSSQTYGIL